VAAAPTRAPNTEYVKYYVVTKAYEGKPENLREIADRFLGSSSRYSEIMDLNAGRRQPDGGKLSDADKLTPGWSLVLPWDAVGSNVEMGVLPTKMPKSSKDRKCVVSEASSGEPSDWAFRRLAVADAWSRTKGRGVTVAVVDSGVDASLPQLGGRVADGADIVTGSGSGGTDCVGTGTGMASLISAKPVKDSSFAGVAPESTIAPIRVAASTAPVRTDDQATAIEVAVSTGAKVIALGAFVDPDRPDVARAISGAVKHDVVVVVGAQVRSEDDKKSDPADPVEPGVLRVGGVGADGKPAARYRPGGVDVVAPGIDVAYLGVAGTGTLSGSGTRYAVALVAGEAALVRAARPKLEAAEITHRITATARKPSHAGPDATFGSGMIDPVAAVTKKLPEEKSAASGGTGAGHPLLLAAVGLVVLGAVVLLVLRLRRMLRADAEEADDVDEPETRQVPAQPPAATGLITSARRG
jgi:subtilisin family serine protease